jgi:hypothetical protein
MLPRTKRKNWSAIRVARSRLMGYLRASEYVLFCAKGEPGEVCEGQILFCREASKCAFRKDSFYA